MHESDVDRRRFHELIARAEEYQAIAQRSCFPKRDARDAFLFNACSLLNVYAASLGLEYIAGEKRGQTTGDSMVDLVLRGLFGQQSYRTQTLNYFRAKQRQHLFVDVWCAFEDALRAIDDAVTPTDKRAAERNSGEHVGIPTIWTRVSAVAKKSGASTKAQRVAHRETVEFWSATRNTIHRNTFYDGPPKTLRLTDRDGIEVEELDLVPGQPASFLSAQRLPLLVDQLVRAWLYLHDNLTDPRLFPMPTSALEDNPYQFG